jgi:toxin ParE1/3/4
MKVVWSPLAIDRVSEIAQYIFEDSPLSAERWVDDVFDAAGRLDTFPESGRVVPEFEEATLREVIFGQYRIIYRLVDDEVRVLTVRHGNRLLGGEDIEG